MTWGLQGPVSNFTSSRWVMLSSHVRNHCPLLLFSSLRTSSSRTKFNRQLSNLGCAWLRTYVLFYVNVYILGEKLASRFLIPKWPFNYQVRTKQQVKLGWLKCDLVRSRAAGRLIIEVECLVVFKKANNQLGFFGRRDEHGSHVNLHNLNRLYAYLRYPVIQGSKSLIRF